MAFIGKIYDREDYPGDTVWYVCYEKKAHIRYGSGVEPTGAGLARLAGLAWSMRPCDGSCVQKEEEIPDAIVTDLTAFLKDGQERSDTTVPPREYAEEYDEE